MAEPLVFTASSTRRKVKVITPVVKEEDDDYTYTDLLARIYTQTGGEKVASKFVLTVPEVALKSTRTCITNYHKICEHGHIDVQYLTMFFQTELCCIVRVVEGKLIINGRYRAPQIEHVLRKYAHAYMLCTACKCFDTELQMVDRLLTMQCHVCKAVRRVQSIKQGFQAKTRYNK